MAHWSEPYIGRPYIHGDADCARLVCAVRTEVFGKPVPDGAEVERVKSAFGRVAQLCDGVQIYGEWTDEPADGDVVLMLCRGRASHVGAYCVVDGEACVLHAMENAGMVVRHRIRELGRVGLAVEGFYKWK